MVWFLFFRKTPSWRKIVPLDFFFFRAVSIHHTFFCIVVLRVVVWSDWIHITLIFCIYLNYYGCCTPSDVYYHFYDDEVSLDISTCYSVGWLYCLHWKLFGWPEPTSCRLSSRPYYTMHYTLRKNVVTTSTRQHLRLLIEMENSKQLLQHLSSTSTSTSLLSSAHQETTLVAQLIPIISVKTSVIIIIMSFFLAYKPLSHNTTSSSMFFEGVRVTLE